MKRGCAVAAALLLVSAVLGPSSASASEAVQPATNPTAALEPADQAAGHCTATESVQPAADPSAAPDSSREDADPSMTAPQADSSRGCQMDYFWGVCFDTLPKLHCCSAAFLGWSEIVVGDSFPVAGNMTQGEPFEPARALRITFPSGREVEIPVEPSGRFSEMVTFDEEGIYRLSRVTANRVEGFGDFAVAYRVELLGAPTVESHFGQHHYRSGVTMAVAEAGAPVELQVRFTDAKGEPVRSRTLGLGEEITTNEDGVARLVYDPDAYGDPYSIARLYPGLGVLTYRTVTIDASGTAHGLPTGDVAGFVQDGRVYLPLRQFLEKAHPYLFGDQSDMIRWNAEAHTVEIPGISIMVDTGMVLGRGDFRADVQLRDGTTYMELDSLIQLLDRLGMARRTGEYEFLLSFAQEP